jgi:hypothetical protein
MIVKLATVHGFSYRPFSKEEAKVDRWNRDKPSYKYGVPIMAGTGMGLGAYLAGKPAKKVEAELGSEIFNKLKKENKITAGVIAAGGLLGGSIGIRLGRKRSEDSKAKFLIHEKGMQKQIKKYRQENK